MEKIWRIFDLTELSRAEPSRAEPSLAEPKDGEGGLR